jgi:lysophospholipase L1-like esterase
MPKEKRRFRALGINILLCTTSVSIFLGGIELLARLKYTPQQHNDFGVIFDYDKNKAFRLKKNFSGIYADKPFTTNSFGYRSPEIAIKKPENAKRVLIVGDSVTFGDGVFGNEIYPSLLEKTLNQHFSDQGTNTVVEVINTAVPMNSPYQEYYDLMQGLQFDPDVIILQMTLNDIFDMPFVKEFTSKKHLDHVLKERSAFYLFFKDMYNRVRFRDITGENITEKAQAQIYDLVEYMINDPNNPELLEAWDMALEWIQKMADAAREENIPLIILFTPFDLQFGLESKRANPQRFLRTFAKKEGAYYIDLLEILQTKYVESVLEGEVTAEDVDRIIIETNRDNPDLLRAFLDAHFLDYSHLNPEGHRLTESLLRPYTIEALLSPLP